MKTSKAPKSLYASKAPPSKVSIKGASPKLSMSDMRLEYNGLLAMFAVLIEHNDGKLLIDTDTLKKVTKEGRTIQIVPGTLGYTFQFDYYVEPTEETEAPAEENDFLASDVAAEAREYLANQRKAKDGN